jgi:hypothetical protein
MARSKLRFAVSSTTKNASGKSRFAFPKTGVVAPLFKIPETYARKGLAAAKAFARRWKECRLGVRRETIQLLSASGAAFFFTVPNLRKFFITYFPKKKRQWPAQL